LQLYLVRHGATEDLDPARHETDADRRLTADGIAQFRKTARGFAAVEGNLDVILASPLIRARETAELLAEAAGNPALTSVESLKPGAVSVQSLAKDLQTHCRDSKRVAAVGHEPDLSELMSAIISDRAECRIAFKKGAICRLDLRNVKAPLPGQLRWFVTAEQLRRFA
jgi:phosphohistidine phosphatase